MEKTGSIDASVQAVLASAPRAVGGEEGAARRYARAWRQLVRDLVGDRSVPPAAVDVLDHVALTAPFAARGPIDALVSAARGIIPGMTSLRVTARPSPLPDARDYQRFRHAVLLELSGAGTGLERLMAGWQLSVTDVARMFRVARQAVQQWLDEGVPVARQSKLATILRIADLLERNLLPERIPGAVRTPAADYGDRTILDAIHDDDHDDVLASIARSFEWAASA
jgi:hypothetical protein